MRPGWQSNVIKNSKLILLVIEFIISHRKSSWYVAFTSDCRLKVFIIH